MSTSTLYAVRGDVSANGNRELHSSENDIRGTRAVLCWKNMLLGICGASRTRSPLTVFFSFLWASASAFCWFAFSLPSRWPRTRLTYGEGDHQLCFSSFPGSALSISAYQAEFSRFLRDTHSCGWECSSRTFSELVRESVLVRFIDQELSRPGWRCDAARFRRASCLQIVALSRKNRLVVAGFCRRRPILKAVAGTWRTDHLRIHPQPLRFAWHNRGRRAKVA